MGIGKLVIAAIMGSPFLLAGEAKAIPVDLELSLLVDVSGSVSTSEFNLQRGAYADAFKSDSLQNLITSTNGGRIGAIAVNLVYWSSSQVEAVGWTLIDSAAASESFGDAVAAAARPFSGGTSIGPALDFATPLFDDNGFEGNRLVIDVSGDGTSNTAQTEAARDLALQTVDAINGVAIGSASILTFYQNSVIGGTNSFALFASDFDGFATALNQKLEAEIGGGGTPSVPEPGALALLAAGLIGLTTIRRRKAD